MDINEYLRNVLLHPQVLEHAPVKCELTNYWYRGSTARKGGCWTDQYTCPTCKRQGKFLRNYLGQRSVFCDGLRFTKEHREVTR